MLESLKSQNVIDQKVFAFFLSQEDDYNALMSSVSFGSWDLAAYALTDFTYLPVDSKEGEWTVPITSFRIGSTWVYSPNSAVFDPNDYNIFLPSYVYRSFRRAVCNIVTCDPASSYSIEFECYNNEIELLPDLYFELNGVEFSLSTKFYVKVWRYSNCQMNVQESFDGLYGLGVPFMQAYYTLFDAENNRIGVARSVNYPYEEIGTASVIVEPEGGTCVVLVASVLAGALTMWVICRRWKTVQSELIEPLLGNSA